MIGHVLLKVDYNKKIKNPNLIERCTKLISVSQGFIMAAKRKAEPLIQELIRLFIQQLL